MNENPEQRKRKQGKNSHRIGKYEGSARKRCNRKKIKLEKGTKEARAKASKVLSFCENCDGNPIMNIFYFFRQCSFYFNLKSYTPGPPGWELRK